MGNRATLHDVSSIGGGGGGGSYEILVVFYHVQIPS